MKDGDSFIKQINLRNLYRAAERAERCRTWAKLTETREYKGDVYMYGSTNLDCLIEGDSVFHTGCYWYLEEENWPIILEVRRN